MKIIIFIFLFFCFVPAYASIAQTLPDTTLRNYMSDVKKFIHVKDYSSADETLKKVFALKKILPDEVAYYYGIILLKQEKFVQAKASFKKYNSLAGEKGEFCNSATLYIKEADNSICKICNGTGNYESIDSCMICNGKGRVSKSCKTCKGKGMIYCSSCTGAGVIKQSNNFGDSYVSCKMCHGKGLIQCQTCGGSKNQILFCETCRGKGLLKSNKVCDHKRKP